MNTHRICDPNRDRATPNLKPLRYEPVVPTFGLLRVLDTLDGPDNKLIIDFADVWSAIDSIRHLIEQCEGGTAFCWWEGEADIQTDRDGSVYWECPACGESHVEDVPGSPGED